MSLSRHLNDSQSPVRRFIDERFGDLDRVAVRVRERLSGSPTLSPPGGKPVPGYHGVAGTAVDYRLRFFFGTPPVAELTAFRGALFVMPPEEGRAWGLLHYGFEEVAHAAPADVSSPQLWSSAVRYAEEGIPVQFRLHRGPAFCAVAIVPVRWPLLPAGVATASFRGLESLLERCPPRSWQGEEAEAELARYCTGLAFFDALVRAGPRIRSPLLYPEPAGSPEEILARTGPWVEDVCRLALAFYEDRGHGLLEAGSVILGPTFAGSPDVGGADADLVADGCLVEFKATTRPGKDLRRTLRQILGYVLLDYEDALKVEAVGVYFVRQRRFFTWGLGEFLEAGSGGRFGARDLPELRAAFRRAVRENPLTKVGIARGEADRRVGGFRLGRAVAGIVELIARLLGRKGGGRPPLTTWGA
jgi:hypothetical protein